ncbi:tRNA (adenine(22)-N(1))-methyltransferase TrmK [Vibrio mimicus]
MKLGKRLTQLAQQVNRHYDHIWDCCCDHGLLGAALLKQHPSSTVHFVDIVPSLIEKVTLDLTRYFPATTNSPRWRTYCLDVRDLPLEENAGSHLVIIAGVGGDLMTEFITDLAKRHPATPLDLLLCPVHHTYTLREQLIALNAELKCELLVEENQRIYELLHVQIDPSLSAPSHPLSLVGKSLWQASGADQSKITQRYLQQLQQHYQRKAQGGDAGAEQRWQAYQAVEIIQHMDSTLELAQ